LDQALLYLQKTPPLNTYLNELISHLETEKQRLQALIDACVAEKDYEYAALHQKGMYLVETQLNRAMQLKDPLHEEKLSIERQKEMYKKLLADSSLQGVSDLYLERLKTAMDKYDQFVIPPHYDAQEIDNALYDLMDGKINGFRFYLKKDDGVVVEFRRTGERVRMMVDPRPWLREDEYSYHHVAQSLAKAGLMADDLSGELYRYVDIRKSADVLTLKELLAHIVYNIFGVYAYNGTAFLEILDS
jgi:hypothetical protein